MSQQPIQKSNNHTNGKLATEVNTSVEEMIKSEESPQKLPRNYSLIIGIGIGIITSMVGINLFGQNQAPESVSTTTPVISSTTRSNVSQTITTTTAQIMDVESKLAATGTILPYELIPVMSKANNLQIIEVLVDEGDVVAQGQILIRLDDSLLKAELKQAQAVVQQAQARLAELKAGTRAEELARAKESVNIAQADILQGEADLQLAQAKLQRNRQLEVEGAIAADRLEEFVNDELVKKSNLQKNRARLREAQQRLLELQKGARKEVLAQAQASLSEAQARVKLIETRLKDTIVKSPVNGKVAERNARVGDVASASSNQKLLTIIQDSRLELEVRVPENELRDIAPQQKVKISSTANPNLNLTGIVRDVNPIIDRDSRQAIVNVDLPTNNDLKPGMFVQASIITTTSPSLTIPMKAVIPQNNGQGTVYVLQENNTVKAQQVSLGKIVDNEAIEILSGIQLGDIVALKGVNYLQDGNAVKIVSN